jgi:hypothetical protein
VAAERIPFSRSCSQVSPNSVEALTKAFHLKAVASCEHVRNVVDQLNLIRGKGLFTNASAALDAYSEALSKLTSLPNDEGLIATLADLDEATRKQLRSAIGCAADDAAACRKLLQNRLIDTVSTHLRDELQRTLETVKLPIAGALDAWSTKADNWIRAELAKERARQAALVRTSTGAGSTEGTAGNGSLVVSWPSVKSNKRFAINSENDIDAVFVDLRAVVAEQLAHSLGPVWIDVAGSETPSNGAE